MFGQSLLSAFGSAACTTDTDQLFTTDVQTTSLATYQLNNATTSIPSNTYPGTASNITYAAGKFGNAAVFNGSSSYIDLGSTIDDPLRTAGAFGTSMWFKTPSGGQVNSYGGKLISLLNNIYLFINIQTNNTLLARVGQSNGTQREFTTSALSASTWYHIVFTGNSSNGVTLYLNGSSQGNLSWDGTFDTYTNPDYKFNYLGYQGSGVSYLTGTLDQVRIFNSALPQSAVTALYNETTTTATYPYITTEVANPNSVAYYKMSDATDQFGNYNGTATNVNFNTVGKFGFAGAFNGLQNSSASYINISSSTTSTTSSVSLWFNTTVKDSNYGNILDAGGGSSANTGFAIIRMPTTGFLQVNFTGGTVGSVQSFTGSTDITDGNWHNIVLSMASDNTFVFYLDGLSHLSGTRTKFTVGQSQNLSINRFGTNAGSIGASSYGGSIDQVRIYDSALSAENVTALYNEIECPAVAVTNAFNTVLYSGNSSTQAITGAGFEPDFTWIKRRDGTENHYLQDSVRGSTQQIYSNLTNSQFNETTAVTSFSANGFNMGSYNGINNSGETYVSWNWKAGGTAVSNTDGTITSQVSANVNAGFSIVSWTSSSTASDTIGSGLGERVEFLITKKYSGSRDWHVWHKDLPNNGYLNLNSTSGESTPNGNRATVTNDTTFIAESTSGDLMIAYCFASIPGYSQVGSYVGTGASGNYIYTGFRPAFLMTKRSSAAGGGWNIFDNKRGTDKRLYPNLSNAEGVDNPEIVTFNSNGFTFNTADSWNNGSYTYIFLAIA